MEVLMFVLLLSVMFRINLEEWVFYKWNFLFVLIILNLKFIYFKYEVYKKMIIMIIFYEDFVGFFKDIFIIYINY